VQILKEFLSYGISKPDIGVITPYNAQVNLIKKSIRHSPELKKEITIGVSSGEIKGIEVATVDGFQGREKEVIVISMVRSNPSHQIGFLSNERRMNVAVTRAKRLCVLIGDSGTLNKNEFLKGLVDYFKS
jgi:superfamily I DNA and/or RNA helicase